MFFYESATALSPDKAVVQIMKIILIYLFMPAQYFNLHCIESHS